MVRVAMPIGTTAAVGLTASPAITAGVTLAADSPSASSFATGGDAPVEHSPFHLHPLTMSLRRHSSWAMPLASLAMVASALMASDVNAMGGDLLPSSLGPVWALGIWGAWSLEGMRRRLLGQDRFADYWRETRDVVTTADHMPAEDRKAFLAALRNRVLSVNHQPVARSGVYVVEHTTANIHGGRGEWSWQFRFNGSGQTTYMLVDRQFVTEGGVVRLSDRPKELRVLPDESRRLAAVLDGDRSPQFFTLQNSGGLVTHFAAAEVPGPTNRFRQAMLDFRLQQARFDAAVSDLQTLPRQMQLFGVSGVAGPKTGTNVYLIRTYGSDGDYDVGMQKTVMMVDLAAERGVRYTFGQDEILRQDVKGIWMTAEDVQRWDRALDRETGLSAAEGYLGWAAIELPMGHPSLNAIGGLERIRQDFDDTHRAVTAALKDFLATMPANPLRNAPFNPPPGF